MTIPFLDLFKRAKSKLGKQSEPPRMIVPRGPLPEKPASERLSKTVMPNTTRTVAPADPFQTALGKGRSPLTPTSLTPTVTTDPRGRTISLTLADLLEHLPASSLKSRDAFDANRTITIKAAEIEKGMATGKPTALLTSIQEQAPEMFRETVSPNDLTEVPLPFDKVLQQFQALQVRDDQMQDEDVPQLETPFLQVTIEDTKKFGTSLAPLQTSAKPPVKLEPATARAIAKAEPEPVAQEKHSTTVAGRRPISLTPKTQPSSAPNTPPSGPVQPSDAGAPSAPTRIPFKLPPNGAGVPASERVPASSGPPVPTPPSAPPKAAAPSRIPFKMTPPGPSLKPKLTLVPGTDPGTPEDEEAPATQAAPAPSIAPVSVKAPMPTASAAESAKATTSVVRLRLNVCLRNLPAFQLAGELPEIGDDNFIELPYSVIEPQLASGRVAIEPKLFHGAIPEKFRQLFVVDTAGTPVLLPLQEVLQHLPTAALKMREDQEHDEAIDQFETPFSFHAKEDQKRFGKGNLESATPTEGDKPTATTAAEPMPVTAAPEIPKEKVSETAKAESTTAVPPVSDVNPTPEHAADVAKPSASVEVEKQPVEAKAEEKKTADQPPPAAPATVAPEKTVAEAAAKSNAKEFVLRVSCLPGVSGCSIGFADGLMMAGNLPPNLGADGLCAMAPSVLQKVEKHMPGTDLGTFTSMTLHCTKSPLSFFMQGNVCLTVLHTDQNLEPVTQEQLVEMTRELAQTFAQPETTHVDH